MLPATPHVQNPICGLEIYSLAEEYTLGTPDWLAGLERFFNSLRTPMEVTDLLMQVECAQAKLLYVQRLVSEEELTDCIQSLDVFYKELRWLLGQTSSSPQSIKTSRHSARTVEVPDLNHQCECRKLAASGDMGTSAGQIWPHAHGSLPKLHSSGSGSDAGQKAPILRGWSWVGQTSDSFEGFLLGYFTLSCVAYSWSTTYPATQ